MHNISKKLHTSRFQPEEIKISEEIVMKGEKLKIKFWQSKAAFTTKVFSWHNIFIPYDFLSRIQRHFIKEF